MSKGTTNGELTSPSPWPLSTPTLRLPLHDTSPTRIPICFRPRRTESKSGHHVGYLLCRKCTALIKFRNMPCRSLASSLWRMGRCVAGPWGAGGRYLCKCSMDQTRRRDRVSAVRGGVQSSGSFGPFLCRVVYCTTSPWFVSCLSTEHRLCGEVVVLAFSPIRVPP